MLELRDLRKRFGDVVALDGASLTVQRGAMVGFLGPNGAGKSTTMRSVFGLVRVDDGEMRWDGHPVTTEDRLRFGYMPEERGLYPRMRLRDQLTYFGEVHGMSDADASASADQWLERLSLTERAGDRVETLSHGNQQRVQLAAALVHDPELLMLDEPFSGLDPVAVEILADVLRAEARRGKAVVFSSHQLDLVEDVCEDVVTINRGRVVLAGRLADLKESSPIRRIEVDLSSGDASWIPDDPGIVERRVDGSRVSLVVERDIDIEGLLAAVLSHGTISQFSYEPPSLSDLFLEAVSS